MWKANAPRHDIDDVVKACTDRIRDKDRGKRLRTSLPQLETYSNTYRTAAAAGKIHALDPADFVVPNVSHTEMTWFYDQRLAAQRCPGRQIYQAVLDSAIHSRCPYCSFGVAKTVDHVVAKEHFDGLAINPWNLVPCCKDCNHAKGSSGAACAEQEPIHPYFIPEIGRWLRAELLPGSPLSVIYRSEPEEAMDSLLAARLANHFDLLGLSELFASASSTALVEITSNVAQNFGRGQSGLVSAHLRETADDLFRRMHGNYWRAVLCEALAESEWYCETGFQTI